VLSACNPNTSYEQTGVTNQTACDDGFVNGWKQWCNTDLILCAKNFLSNVFPGRLANNQTYVAMCLKTRADNAHSTDNVLSPLSKHCGGSVGSKNNSQVEYEQ